MKPESAYPVLPLGDGGWAIAQEFTLLLVDDDPFALELQLHTAREAFPEGAVHIATDSMTVADMCGAMAYDCVILDYDMPRLDGLELAQQLRQAHPHLPIVLCTGAGDELLAAKALQGGVTDYIPKSVIKPPSLRRTVLQAIRITENAKLIDQQRGELETFAFALAHDFKQPLRQITTFAELARQEVELGAVEDLKQHLAFLSGAARRLSALVDVMSEYTLLNKPVELKSVRVAPIVDGVLQSLSGYIAERRAVVEIDGDGCVLGNGVLLHQILQNLIVNGLNYNESPQPEVTLTVWPEDGKLVIAVRDNGIGIAPEYLEQVFRPLARLHTSAEYVGTGLGLTMARKAASQQGGRIDCTSEPGVGSEFTVRLPLAPA